MRVPDFRKIVKFGSAFYKNLGHKTINKHIQSILKGNDVRGKPFKPYSKSYAKSKGVGVKLTAHPLFQFRCQEEKQLLAETSSSLHGSFH